MSNIYTAIATSGTTISEIKAALTAKYSTNITFHYESTTDLIFSCSLISNKVIRINVNTSNQVMGYYGDSWTSGTTIVNSVQFYGYNQGSPLNFNLICGDSFILFSIISSSSNTGVLIVGKLTNGNCIAFGVINYNNYSNNSYIKDTTLGQDVRVMTWDRGFTSSTGKLYKQPLVFQLESGVIEENSDGTFATIEGIYNISYETTPTTYVKTDSYFISNSKLYRDLGDQTVFQLSTALLVELSV